MFIGISMIFVAAKLFYDSISTLILGSELQFSWLLILVCIITELNILFLLRFVWMVIDIKKPT